MNRREMLLAVVALAVVPRRSLATRKSSAEEYCLRRSPTLRSHREESHWLIGRAVEILPESPARDVTREAYSAQLKKQLIIEIRAKYKSAILIWILLYVVLPIVIKLVINWWFDEAGKVE